MKSILVIPLRSLSDSKSRLTGISNKRDFVSKCVEDILETSRECKDITDVVLVSHSEEIKELASSLAINYFHSAKGLNESVSSFRTSHIRSHPDTSLIACLGDLPLISSFDVFTSSLETNDLVLASDRHLSGTNIIGIRNSVDWNFQFGENSLKAHITQANKKKLQYKILNNYSFSLDIDLDEDFKLYKKIKQ